MRTSKGSNLIMVYLFLADGFEEVEALCPLDLLRRAGAEVKTVGVTGKYVTGAHDISVAADILPEEMVLDRSLDMIVLPGGMPGTTNLDASGAVHEAIRYAHERGITIGAICAAPMIIGKLGYLSGRSAICYPGFEKYLVGANISAKPVVPMRISSRQRAWALPHSSDLRSSPPPWVRKRPRKSKNPQ